MKNDFPSLAEDCLRALDLGSMPKSRKWVASPVSFSSVAQIPFKNLPTDLLLSIRDDVCEELSKRCGDKAPPRTRPSPFRVARQQPTVKKQKLRERLSQLDSIMAEDWSDLFDGGDSESRYYVYAHCTPEPHGLKHMGKFALDLLGVPFYIGKGTGNRAWDMKRNQGHGIEIKQLRSQGYIESDIVSIVRDNLTESAALEMESKLIYFFRTKFEHGCDGVLVNLDFPARPYR
jgi:hypothetical protein